MEQMAKRNYFPKAQSKVTAGKEDQQGDKLVEAMPVLYYREGKPNNLNEFKEKLSTYLISKYSDCGTFIETWERCGLFRRWSHQINHMIRTAATSCRYGMSTTTS